MKDRLEIELTLNDGNTYIFPERNREDVLLDYWDFCNDLKKQNLKLIDETEKNPDDRLALKMHELDKVYYAEVAINLYKYSRDYKLKSLFESFKLANQKIDYDGFIELFPAGKETEYYEILLELEKKSQLETVKATE
jgi:hypothetical protein